MGIPNTNNIWYAVLDFFIIIVYNFTYQGKKRQVLIMYNEKIKNEYLSTIPATTAKTHKSYFGKIEEYEKKLNKDIALFTKDEFVKMIKDITGLSVGSSLYNFKDCIKRYAKWYSENYTQVNYEEVFTIDYLEIIPDYYRSPLELIEDINMILRDKMLKYNISLDKFAKHLQEIRMTYNIPIGIILLLWCGLSMEEIVNLKSINVFPKENSIYIEEEDRVVLVDASVMAVLNQLKLGNSYAKCEKNEKDEYDIIICDFQYTKYFLKKRECGRIKDYSTPVSQGTINSVIRDFNNNSLDKTFQFTKLYENGMFYRAYQKQKSMSEIRFKRGKDKDDYLKIFDDWTKEVSQNRFKELKYKYRAFVKMIENNN